MHAWPPCQPPFPAIGKMPPMCSSSYPCAFSVLKRHQKIIIQWIKYDFTWNDSARAAVAARALCNDRTKFHIINARLDSQRFLCNVNYSVNRNDDDDSEFRETLAVITLDVFKTQQKFKQSANRVFIFPWFHVHFVHFVIVNFNRNVKRIDNTKSVGIRTQLSPIFRKETFILLFLSIHEICNVNRFSRRIPFWVVNVKSPDG